MCGVKLSTKICGIQTSIQRGHSELPPALSEEPGANGHLEQE